MKRISTFIVSVLLLAVFSLPSIAMPPKQMKQILNMTKNNWVSFRDFNGKQLIYFTHLESYTCGIKEVRYSINSDDLDKVWELPALRYQESYGCYQRYHLSDYTAGYCKIYSCTSDLC